MSRLVLLLGVLISLAAGPAHAEWRKAETRHFVVYSEGSERDLRDYAVGLERIDQLMRAYFAVPEAEDAPPLPVYLVRSRREFREVEPRLPDTALGVYSANFRDIRAVAIRTLGDEILRHEYGHHFMFSNFPGSYPAWFREGFAEFFMTATVDVDGRATVGRSSPMRVQTLNSLRWLPMEQVLTGRFDHANRAQRAAFYAQSWLMMHWVLTDPERRRSMDAYLGDTARGVAVDAALQARFGMDADQLDRALKTYFHAGPRYAETTLDAASPPVTISALPASADDVLLLEVNARNGGPADLGPDLLARGRAAVAQHPGDVMALRTLARIEVLWGDPEEAARIVQPLLQAAPADVDLLLLMAETRLAAGDRLDDPAAREGLYAQARAFLARAYQADPGEHRVYQSLGYSRRFAPDYPNDNDVELWRRAVAIAPQVASNRPVAAEAMLEHGLVDEAERVIQPVANDPHGEEISPRVQRILDRIAAARAAPAG